MRTKTTDRDDPALSRKLYVAYAGLPRQLLDAFATLGDCARAIAEMEAIKPESLSMTVRVDIERQREQGPSARFAYEGRSRRYVIEVTE